MIELNNTIVVIRFQICIFDILNTASKIGRIGLRSDTKKYRNDYFGFTLPRKHTLHGFANPKDNSETKSYQ